MNQTRNQNNPIGNQKPHAFLLDYIKQKYRVVIDINYGNSCCPLYHPITDKPYMQYCVVTAYNNMNDLNAGRDAIVKATSYCSEKDQYDKHLGLTIALRRLNIELKKAEKTSGYLFKH